MFKKPWRAVSNLKKGPQRRDSLSSDQLGRLKAIRKILVEVDHFSMDQWIDNFQREANPDSELTVWEGIALTHYNYCEGHELTLDQKKEVYGLLILRSGTSTEDVLAHAPLRSLTEMQAREAMDMFRVYPDRQLRLK